MGNSTSPEPVQDGRLQKRNPALKALDHSKSYFKKSRSKENEQVSDPAQKQGQLQPPKAQTAPGKPPPPVNKQLPSIQHKGIHDKDEIEKLQKEFQDMERGMSTDTVKDKMVDNHSQSLVPYGSNVGSSTLPRPVMSITHVPQTTHPSPSLHLPNETRHFIPPQLVPGNGTLPAARVTHTTLVAEPETFAHGPLQSMQPNGQSPLMNPYEHYEGPTANRYESKSYEGLRSDLEVAQFDNEDLRRQLDAAQRDAAESVVNGLSLDSLQQAHATTLRDLNNLRTNQERAVADAAQLRNANTELQANALSWQSQFDRVNNELLLLRSDLSNHVNDKWFQAQWRDLHDRIETLSHQYFMGRLTKTPGSMLSRTKGSRPEKLEYQPAVSLTRLTDENARYLASDHERPLIIQAFVWYVLVNRIFAHTSCDDGGFYWAGQSRELLYHLKRQIRPPRPRDWSQYNPNDLKSMETNARNYHKWRATTSMLLLARVPVDKRMNNIGSLISDLINDMIVVVSPYAVTTRETPLTAAEAGIRKQLGTILDVAIGTDAQMAQQRAWIYCEQWRAPMEGDPLWGFQWEPEDSEMLLSSEQIKGRRKQFKDPCVELIVQPALFREGNQYGEEYGMRHVLCKVKVVIAEHPTLPTIRRR